MNHRTLDARHPTVALITDQHTRIIELEFENGLLAKEVDRLRALLQLPPTPRPSRECDVRSCRACGRSFTQAGPGRPRLNCYTCAPMRKYPT